MTAGIVLNRRRCGSILRDASTRAREQQEQKQLQACKYIRIGKNVIEVPEHARDWFAT